MSHPLTYCKLCGVFESHKHACVHNPEGGLPDPTSFQARVHPWMLECFVEEIAVDRIERNHRFFEESTELVQANGMTRSEAHQLVDYTFDRPVGELNQEAGGVMVTLAALCLASGIDMHTAGETELARIWTKVDKIRAKQAAKPKHSPLPEVPAAQIPAGWKIVPIEPDTAMQAVGADGIRMDTTVLNRIFTANRVYRAMLTAAPECAQAQPGAWQAADADIESAIWKIDAIAMNHGFPASRMADAVTIIRDLLSAKTGAEK